MLHPHSGSGVSVRSFALPCWWRGPETSQRTQKSSGWWACLQEQCHGSRAFSSSQASAAARQLSFRVYITAFFFPIKLMAGNSFFLPRCICWWRRTWAVAFVSAAFAGPLLYSSSKADTRGWCLLGLGGDTSEHRSALPWGAWEVDGGAGLCAPASWRSLCFVSPSSTLCSRICIYGKCCHHLLPLSPAPRCLRSADSWAFPAERCLPSPAKRVVGLGASPPPSAVPFPRGPWGGRGAGRTSGGFLLNSL